MLIILLMIQQKYIKKTKNAHNIAHDTTKIQKTKKMLIILLMIQQKN